MCSAGQEKCDDFHHLATTTCSGPGFFLKVQIRQEIDFPHDYEMIFRFIGSTDHESCFTRHVRTIHVVLSPKQN